MCLAIPMQITRIDGFEARCAIRGVERDVSLFMLQGEDVGRGLTLRMDHGTQYTADDILNQIRF